MDSNKDADNPIPSNLPPAMRRKLRSAMIDGMLEPIRERGRARIESTIHLELWRDLGDLTETYWDAMSGANAYVAVDRLIFAEMDKIPHSVRVRVMQAIADTLLTKIAIQKEMAATIDSIKRLHPLPGDEK